MQSSCVRIIPTKIVGRTLMLRYKALFSLCCCICLTLIVGSAQAEFYRWVDDEGVVNFTQRRPLNVDAVMIGKPPAARSYQAYSEAPAPTTVQSSQLETQFKLSADQQERYDTLQQKEAERQAKISSIRSSNCKRSKALLQRLSANGRIRVRAPDGDERHFPDEERTQRIAEAQRGIVVNCDTD